jgi:parallel beta-helix repeat protein
MRRALAIALAGGWAAVVAADEFHVAIGGNDGGPGTVGQPWATVQHAVDSVGPGDTILVHGGSFVGARIELSGAAGQPITLRAAPGEPAVLTQPGSSNFHGSTLELETFSGGGTVAYWVVQGFEILGGSRSGVDIRNAHHITVRSNRVHGSGLTGIFTAFADDVTIEGNESFGNGEHGVYTSNSGDRPTVRGNHLHDNAAAGLHMNADLSQGGDGIITGAIVAANVIHGNGGLGGAGINMDGVSESAVFNNLIYDEHASGIAVFQQDGAVCSSDNLFAHNTVLTAADGRWAFNMPDAGCTGNLLVDNFFWTDHAFRGAVAIWTAHPAGFASHHNIVMDRFSIDGGDTVIDFAAWTALGYGAGTLVSTPEAVFVDPAADDYHLLADGPAVDAGQTLPEVTVDLEGNPRPQGASSDPGCYESGPGIFADGFESGDTSAWSMTLQ